MPHPSIHPFNFYSFRTRLQSQQPKWKFLDLPLMMRFPYHGDLKCDSKPGIISLTDLPQSFPWKASRRDHSKIPKSPELDTVLVYTQLLTNNSACHPIPNCRSSQSGKEKHFRHLYLHSHLVIFRADDHVWNLDK